MARKLKSARHGARMKGDDSKPRKATAGAAPEDDGDQAEKLPHSSIVKRHWRIIGALRQKQIDANMELAQAYKEAETAGLDRAAIKFLQKMHKQDQAKRASFLAHVEHYSQFVGGQMSLDLHDTAPAGGNGKDAPLPALDRDRIFHAGLKAGKAAKDLDANEYLAGTERADAWALGWKEGQKQLAEKQFGPGGKPTASAAQPTA